MQGIYTYIPETNHVPREYSISAILSLLFMVSISLVPALALLYFYVSTFRSMCAVPNMAVFCSSFTSWFPGMLFTYFLNYYYYYYYHYIIIISFMQGIYTYIPETNHIPREYSVPTILSLLFMVYIASSCVGTNCTFTLALSEVCVQCPIWLFSVVPSLHGFLVCCLCIFWMILR